MIKGYLAALALLGLGLAGVGTLALQATQRLEEGQGARTKAPSEAQRDPGPGARARPGEPTRPRTPPPRERVRTAADPDAGAPTTRPLPSPDAGAPVARPAPDAAAPPVAAGPPRPAGPAPALVVEFREGSTKTAAGDYRQVRDLVEKRGYKGVQYQLTGYAGERQRAKNNRALARQRCQRVMRLFRKRGVSRRWLSCTDPVYRTPDGAVTEAHRAAAWRRVEVRVQP